MTRYTWITALVLTAAAAGLLWQTSARHRVVLYFERGAVERAVHHYFACEMKREFEPLYHSLAPSSVYRQTHTYEDFLADVENSPVRIRDYRIVDIYNLRANHDTAAYPLVEQYVQAEVEVVVYYTDTDRTARFNYSFTFLKEGGRWLKG